MRCGAKNDAPLLAVWVLSLYGIEGLNGCTLEAKVGRIFFFEDMASGASEKLGFFNDTHHAPISHFIEP